MRYCSMRIKPSRAPIVSVVTVAPLFVGESCEPVMRLKVYPGNSVERLTVCVPLPLGFVIAIPCSKRRMWTPFDFGERCAASTAVPSQLVVDVPARSYSSNQLTPLQG